MIEQGPDGFTLADACRRAGVTTAAPYKHFRDKQEILEEIVLRGFEELTAANAKAVAEGGPGTIEGITAMGISYLDFAVAQPALFRLMFGHKSEIMKVRQVEESGKQCLKNVIEEVAAYSRKHGHAADAEEIALQALDVRSRRVVTSARWRLRACRPASTFSADRRCHTDVARCGSGKRVSASDKKRSILLSLLRTGRGKPRV